MDKPFSITAPTILVGASAVQITSSPNNGNSFRVRNLSASVQYFTVGQTASVTSAGAPSAGVPSANTIGMLGSSVEVFSGLLPWMIASTSTGFEVTPGDGV